MNTHPQAIELTVRHVMELRSWFNCPWSGQRRQEELTIKQAELRYAEAYVIATAAYIEAHNAVHDAYCSKC